MQPNSLKALARAVLQRNDQRNKDATGQKKLCNFPEGKQPLELQAPTTIEQAIETLDDMGDWTGIIERAETCHPDLLASAKQATKEVDRRLTDETIRHYFTAWGNLFRKYH